MPHRSRKRCCTNATQRWRSWRCANLVAWFYQWGIAPIMAISYGKWSTIGLLDNDSALSRSTGIHGMVQLTSDHIIQNPWKFLVTLHCCRQINHITVLLVSSVATPFIHWGWYFHPFEENSLKLWNIQIVLVTFHITEQPKSCSGFRGIVRPVSKNYQNVLSKSVIRVTFHCNSKFRAFFEHQRSRFKDWNLQPLSIISQHLEYTHAHMLIICAQFGMAMVIWNSPGSWPFVVKCPQDSVLLHRVSMKDSPTLRRQFQGRDSLSDLDRQWGLRFWMGSSINVPEASSAR